MALNTDCPYSDLASCSKNVLYHVSFSCCKIHFRKRRKKHTAKQFKKQHPFPDPNTFRLSCLCLLPILEMTSSLCLRNLEIFEEGRLVVPIECPKCGLLPQAHGHLTTVAQQDFWIQKTAKRTTDHSFPQATSKLLCFHAALGVPFHSHAAVLSLIWRFTKVSRHKDHVKYSRNK